MPLQDDLEFLLEHGWKLVDENTVEWDGIKTDKIELAAKLFRIKLNLQKPEPAKNNP